MKKLLIVLLLFAMCACKGSDVVNDSAREKYSDMIVLLREHEGFAGGSELFDVTCDVAQIEGGYRYYVIIDNVKTAMYDVTAIAIEENVDYTGTMAANIGIFEETEYSLIPGQYNAERGFVKGVSISGTGTSAKPTLLLLVEWKNKDMSVTYREFIKIDMGGGSNE